MAEPKAIGIGINGFGRIGTCFMRAAKEMGELGTRLKVRAINDMMEPDQIRSALKRDSTFGMFKGVVEGKGNLMMVDGDEISLFSEKDPAKIRWDREGVDIVIESTGKFLKEEDARKHLDPEKEHMGKFMKQEDLEAMEGGRAKKVLLSAPPKSEGILTVVMGVNDQLYDPSLHYIISNASCTTNCLAPVAKVLHTEFGIEKGFMATIHAVTNTQPILDLAMGPKSGRGSRSGMQSIIPETTGAAKAIGLVIPELKGKLDGMAMRVPVADVSAVYLVAVLSGPATAEAINNALKAASESGPLAGILGYGEEPLVSVDYKGDTRASIVDSLLTKAQGTLVQIVAWYDNEFGYASQLVRLALKVGG